MNARRRLIEERFDVIEELADDGWEAVYLARHKEMGDECLVKVQRRAEDEAPLAARISDRLPWLTRLSHPRLAQLYDVRTDTPGFVVIEMEFVPGTSLDALVADAVSRDEDAPLPVATVFDVLDGCLEAVDWLHSQGWCHGSLAPSKFRLRREEDGQPSVRLADPGVGRLLGVSERTTAGSLLARKLRYTAPERFLGDVSEPTVAADIYVLGLIAYELFTGRYPIAGESATALAAGHLMHPPLSFSESDPGERLSEELRSLLRETLAKEPERRPPLVDDLRRRLRAAAEVETRQRTGEADVLALLLDDSRDFRAKVSEPLTQVATDGSAGTVDVRPAGPSIETIDMREARDEAKRREGKDKVRRLVRDAGEAVNRSDYTAALDLLQEGLRYAPEEPKLVELLRQVESAARRQKAEAQRGRKIDDEVRAVEALLEKGEEAAARDRLLDIEDRLGADPRLAALLRTLEPEEEDLVDEGQDARSRAEDLVSKARRLSRSEDFSGARKALRRAVELDPEHSEARTLSESVQALVELGKQEGRRRREVAEAEVEIRGLLELSDPGAAMVRLNRAVVRFGDLPELQKLRYDVARVFLQEDAVFDAGDATSVPPAGAPRSSAPPGQRPAPQPSPSPSSSPVSSSPPAVSPPAVSPPAPGEEVTEPRTFFDLELAGLGGGDGPAPPGTEAAPEPDQTHKPSPWLDLRDPRGLLLLFLLLALVAFLGHWAATRGRDGAKALDPEPEIEVEDIDQPSIRVRLNDARQTSRSVRSVSTRLSPAPALAESNPALRQTTRVVERQTTTHISYQRPSHERPTRSRTRRILDPPFSGRRVGSLRDAGRALESQTLPPCMPADEGSGSGVRRVARRLDRHRARLAPAARSGPFSRLGSPHRRQQMPRRDSQAAA